MHVICSLQITAEAFTLNRSIFCLISQAARLNVGSRLVGSDPQSNLTLLPGLARHTPLTASPVAGWKEEVETRCVHRDGHTCLVNARASSHSAQAADGAERGEQEMGAAPGHRCRVFMGVPGGTRLGRQAGDTAAGG